MVQGGQSMTWDKSMKSLTNGLASLAAATLLPSRGPRDPPSDG